MDPVTQLENRLSARRADAPPELRDRIMQAISAELSAQSSPRLIWRAPAWSWIAAAAALVMIVINLSFVSASLSGFAVSDRAGAEAARDYQAAHRFERTLNAIAESAGQSPNGAYP